MEAIGGYALLTRITETRHSVIYRAKKAEDDQHVVVKLMRTQSPSSTEIVRFKQEYENIKNLDIEGIVQTYELISYEGGIALILEDFDARSLQQCLNGRALEPPVFLDMAIRLSETLGKLHQKAIVHRDIKPANILVGSKWTDCKIADFGISQLITHEDEDIYNPDVITGTLRYMAPEQAGRMNKSVDYRTDLYALGVTFYEMLTGRPPFESEDPMELIHCHIARRPQPVCEINQAVPGALSDIAMKLLSKPAEERYQNAFGVMADLQYCRQQLETHGKIESFKLAENDVSLKFNVPWKLVGREDEVRELVEAHEAMMEQAAPALVMVAGSPGVGKSALINELYKPSIASRGYFISGKYDQSRRDVPYSSLIQAFIGLVRQILAESDDRTEYWRDRIQQALGSTGKVLTDVIPNLELIIGEQPEVPDLGPEASQYRFTYVFSNFIKAFADCSHPLAMFLDDLQWADLASLKLLEQLFNGMERECLLLIGAYRNNEVGEAHALTKTLKLIGETGITVKTLVLEPLSEENVNDLISDFLRLDKQALGSLPQIVYDKTRGNPFFVNQFLKTLYDKSLLEPVPGQGWRWDETQIAALQVTDNVVDLMADKIVDLPESAQAVIKIGACIGNRFDLQTLSIVMDEAMEQIMKALAPALDAGLLYFSGDMCYFLHDRIQEAAYSLIEETRRSSLHYDIGWYMYRHTSGQELGKNIFYIVNQLNAGKKELADDFERLELARLNLAAGKKAKDTAAYESSLIYLQIGIDLLPANCWESAYDLALSFYTEAARAAYLNASFSEMAACIAQVTAHAANILDCIDVYEIQIQGYQAQGELRAAVDTTYRVLAGLGVKLPRKVSTAKSLREFYQTQLSLRGKTDQALSGIPRMRGSYALGAMRIATSAVVAFFVGGYTREIGILTLKMVRLSVKAGLSEQSPYWFACYTVILFSLNKLDEAFRFGDLALELVQQTGVEEIRTSYMVNSMARHWRDHSRDCCSSFQENYHRGLELGDLEHFAYSMVNWSHHSFLCGRVLKDLYPEIEACNSVIWQYKQKLPFYHNLILLQVMDNLTGESESPTCLDGARYDKAYLLPIHVESKDGVGLSLFYTYGLMLCYIFGDPAGAKENENQVKPYLGAAAGLFTFGIFYFYRTLNMLAEMTDLQPAKRKGMWKKITRSLQKLRVWAKHGAPNYLNKKDLVEAEAARIKTDWVRAESFYEKAISGARSGGFLQEEALAYELAAGFYYERGMKDFAALYLSRAVNRYSRWGALAKVAQLEEKWGEMLSPSVAASFINKSGDTSDSPGISSRPERISMLDLSTVIKGLQAISGEIVLEHLLERLMAIGVENAGAQRGVLLVEQEGGLYVEAERDADGNFALLDSLPLQEYRRLPKTIISYVHKTRENLVVDDARSDERFINDPYIRENGLRSILCAPIRRKSSVSGFLYLENNLSSGAFTEDRLELLKVLSSQAAISIENAKLFEMARRDGLTGLINHRYFQYRLEKEIQKARKNRQPVSLFMIDIDHFKQFNDTYGHQAGDTVLAAVSATLRGLSPDKDLVCRYGGEEFALIYPAGDLEAAKEMAEQIREAVAQRVVHHGEQELKVTASIGIATTYLPQATEGHELISRADRALYRAKEAGRNRVVTHG